MRFSLKRLIQWSFLVVLLQFVVYYWTIRRPRLTQTRPPQHKYLESTLGSEYGTCSFKMCPAVKEGFINVHLIPHSHIDVGWLKTVDQYYTGEDAPGITSNGCVRCILNSTLTELAKNPSRRFIFMEMKYLSRFWNESTPAQRDLIRKLVHERQLEIVSGGWVLSDAGVAMYNDIIDQQTLGFDFIRDNFGPCAQSRTGWQVDQFGHSREHGSIFAQMGYDSIFIGRVDFQDLADRKLNRNMEQIWYTSPTNLKNRSTLFVQTTYDGYYAPPDFVFDNQYSNGQTSEGRSTKFINILQERARTFRTNHLLVPMGSDFGYRNASRWFSQIEALIQDINSKVDNSDQRFHLVYSTPSCYTYYVSQAKEVFETKSDDFFPYGVPPGVYWSGYFSTRGGYKMQIRRAGQILQGSKHLSIFSDLDDSYDQINHLRDALAVAQHHDAVTGTQTRLVLMDYSRELSQATDHGQTVTSRSYHRLWGVDREPSKVQLSSQFCYDLNISSCPISETADEFVTTLYNPLTWPVDLPVRLPTSSQHAKVEDGHGQIISAMIVPVPEAVLHIPERSSTTGLELVFIAHLPPMSVTSYRVQKGQDHSEMFFSPVASRDIIVDNQYLSLTFSSATGKLVEILNRESGIREKVSQDFAFYVGQQGAPRPSGAYVFVPQQTQAILVNKDKVHVTVVQGDLVTEVHQTFSSWLFQVVRLYKGSKHVEFQWVAGPLDDNTGREVISVFETGLDSGDKFYTDSNGRETIQRIRQEANTPNVKIKDFVSGNYFPVTSRIFIKDEKKNVQLTIIPDRSQGGSSLKSGSLELMVHRRLLFDDGLGVGEPLRDQGINGNGIVFTGKHFLILDRVDKSVLSTKHLALQTHLAPVPVFTTFNGSIPDSVLKQFFFLAAPLPDNVHILTLDQVSAADTNLYLLRLEHIFESEEHSNLSQPVEISLQNMFAQFEIVSAEETTLGANFRPHEVTRLKWQTADGQTQADIASPDYKITMEPPFRIIMQPMEIRTFRIQIFRPVS